MSTADRVNEEIRRKTEEDVARIAAEGPEAIDRRLRELDEEWDVERAIEVEAGANILTGTLLGLNVSPKFFLLPAFAAAMLLTHNLHGWYPLLPLFRRMGLRTQHEINQERYALKALRGDLRDVRRGEGDGRPARRAASSARPSA